MRAVVTKRQTATAMDTRISATARSGGPDLLCRATMECSSLLWKALLASRNALLVSSALSDWDSLPTDKNLNDYSVNGTIVCM